MVPIISTYGESIIKKRSRRLVLTFLIVGTMLGCTGHIYKPFKLDIKARPERQAAFSVLKSAEIPSVLIELGFLSSDRDRERLAAFLAALEEPASGAERIARQGGDR